MIHVKVDSWKLEMEKKIKDNQESHRKNDVFNKKRVSALIVGTHMGSEKIKSEISKSAQPLINGYGFGNNAELLSRINGFGFGNNADLLSKITEKTAKIKEKLLKDCLPILDYTIGYPHK